MAEHDTACHACGYNLRGGRDVYCPECGTVIPAPIAGESRAVRKGRVRFFWWLTANSAAGLALAVTFAVRLAASARGPNPATAHHVAEVIVACVPLVLQLGVTGQRAAIALPEKLERRGAVWAAVIGTFVVAGSCLELL